jgi:oxaloacetate decarboxylase (Na+ extruding) subunit gamma
MNELLSQALELMLAGMGFVFVFLIILIFATAAMSKLVARFLPEPAPVPKASPATASSALKPAQADAQLLAVISAAVKEYRSRHKK